MYNPYLTEETFFVATKCCFFYEGKLLVLSESRPGKPLWREFPGGKISKGDKDLSPLKSLEREVEEELGWNINFHEGNIRLFHVLKSYEITTFSEHPVPFIFLCYLHVLESLPPIVLSHEHTEVLWILQDQIDTLENWRGGFDQIAQKAFTTYLP